MSTVGENDDPSDCSSPRTSSDEDDEEAILLTWKQGLWMILKVLTLHHWPHKWNFSFWDEIYTTMNLLWDELWPSQESKKDRKHDIEILKCLFDSFLFVQRKRQMAVNCSYDSWPKYKPLCPSFQRSLCSQVSCKSIRCYQERNICD